MSSIPAKRTHSRSPRQSPRAPPRRRPLHERTESHANELPSLSSFGSGDGRIYKQSPFPNLPSQVFSPDDQPYVFEDATAQPLESPLIPPKSPRRQSLTSFSGSIGSFLSMDRDAGLEGLALPQIAPLRFSRPSSTATFPSPPAAFPFPGAIYPPSQPEQPTNYFERISLNAAASRLKEEPLGAKTPTSPYPFQSAASAPAQTDQATGYFERRVPTAEAARIEEEPRATTSVHTDAQDSTPYGRAKSSSLSLYPSPSTGSSIARRRRQSGQSRREQEVSPSHSTVERLRSLSYSQAKAPKLAQEEWRTPRASQERPRSVSSPSTPTDAFISALIRSGTDIQYPKIRQASSTSLKSETSFTRAAYPPPLRLQRKRAISQLGRLAAESQNDATRPRVRGAPSTTSFMTQATVSDSVEMGRGAAPHFGHFSANWDDEMVDTLAELHHPALKQQRSDCRLGSTDESRPSSLKSARSSFFTFLNDSVTAWAPVYYRGEGRLSVEREPNVTQVFSSTMPHLRGQSRVSSGPSLQARSATPPTRGQRGHSAHNSIPGRRGHSTVSLVPSRFGHVSSSSGPSQSPRSAGYPDSLYIPRIRPLRRETESSGTGSFNPETSYVPRRKPLQLDAASYESSRRASHHEAESFHSDTFYFPRTRQMQQETGAFNSDFVFLPLEQDADSAESLDESQITALPPPADRSFRSTAYNATAKVPHLSLDKRIGPDSLPYWRAPSFDETRGPFDRLNGQPVLFCIGFVFPPAWWLAAILPLPPRPQWRRSKANEEFYKEHNMRIDLFDSCDVDRYQKARWWRTVNRFMGLAGIMIVAAVIACAVVATR